MENYVLTCCSTADMAKEYFEERDIPYVCFHFHINGKEYEDNFGQSIAFEEFYKMIEEGAEPTTSQINCEEFMQFFEPYLRKGMDIIHVCLSSGISGVYNSACLAQNMLSEMYPERKIYIVDSLGASSGYGLLVDCMADLRDKGYTIDELSTWVEENKLKVQHWFFSTDLTSYRRGGRITGTEAFFGNLFGICPLMNVNNEGKLIPRKKIRTKKKVIDEMVSIMEKYAENRNEYCGKCYISNSACLEDAEKVKKLIEERFPHMKGKIVINSIGTVIGSHTGPGTVALFFMGDLREK